MTLQNVPDIPLPNGVVISGETAGRFLWAGRESGIEWIRTLPQVLQSWCRRWEITLSTELPILSMNLVLFGTSRRYGPVVIKASPPHPEVVAEIDALRLHDASTHVVELIDADPSVSIMLQKRIMPGDTLRSHVESGRLDEHEAATIAAGLMKQYWVDARDTPSFFGLRYWYRALFAYAERFPEGGGRLPHRHVRLAVRAAEELIPNQRAHVTLHGDLHHDNILLDEERGWTIIDPKGLVGEPGHDIGSWMVNPIGVHRNPDLPRLTDQRLDWFSELLDIERYRLWQWAMAFSVLSDCWNLESDDNTALFASPTAAALASLPEADRLGE